MTGILMSVMIRSKRVAAYPVERVASVDRHCDVVAVHLEHAGEQLLDALLVVDDQHAPPLRRGGPHGLGRGHARSRRAPGDHRQLDR